MRVNNNNKTKNKTKQQQNKQTKPNQNKQNETTQNKIKQITMSPCMLFKFHFHLNISGDRNTKIIHALKKIMIIITTINRLPTDG